MNAHDAGLIVQRLVDEGFRDLSLCEDGECYPSGPRPLDRDEMLAVEIVAHWLHEPLSRRPATLVN